MIEIREGNEQRREQSTRDSELRLAGKATAGLFCERVCSHWCGPCATYSSKRIELVRSGGDRSVAAVGLCRESHSVETFVCQIFVMEERMASRTVVISARVASSTKSVAPVGTADKPVNDACFNDWKRFCFVLREIARGDDGRPLSGLEAQQRAQAVLTECGYKWPGRAQAYELAAAPESPNTQATLQSSARTKKSVVRSNYAGGAGATIRPEASNASVVLHQRAPLKSPHTHIPRVLGPR
jgi:hypothetical protein